MAPIDPLQLLKALSPLLSPQGGIRSSDEVSRLSSLMKKFSRKLVSRCIYCNVLRATSPDILEVFLELDGWSTIHMWLQEAKTAENMPFLCELLNLCQILPMSLERLKENGSPKLIKSLMKSSDENVRLEAEKVVSGWMKLIKGDSKEAVRPARDADAAIKKKKKSSSASSDTSKADPVKKERSKGSIDESSSESSNTSSGKHGPSKGSSSAGSSEKETTSAMKEVPAKKPKVTDRPKTVKTFQARFRSTGLEEAPLPPPTKAGTKKVSRPAVDKNAVLSARQRLAPTVHAERRVKPSSLVSMGGDGRETVGPGIRLIPPKPVHVLHEDGGFMDALTAAPAPSPIAAVRRKRRPSGAGTAAGPGGAKNAASTSPTSPTPATPKFQFYKDTLETSEAPREVDSDKTKEAAKNEEEDEDDDIGKRVKRRKRGQAAAVVQEKSNKEGTESPEGEDSPPTPTATAEKEEGATEEGHEVSKASEGDCKEETADKENESEEKSSEVDASSSSSSSSLDRPISILSMTRKKIKKSVRWVEDSKLRQFRYFELDETERVNVNNLHNFGVMKTLEMKRERQAVETARRLMGDRMEEVIPFRPPRRLTLPEPLAEPGANSLEKEIQKLRQQKTLQEIYFSKEMIPDSAYEPDPEQLSSKEPKIIPLEDENGPGGTLDYSHMELPKSNSLLPPILSNLVLSIASKGQPTQGNASLQQGGQQQQLQGGLLPGQFQGGGPMPQQQGAFFQNMAGLHPGSGPITADIQQQQTLTMIALIGPDGGQPGMHLGSMSMGGDPNGPPFMHGNSMQNQGIGMMGPPMGIGGAGGFPMGAGGPMPNAGDWGMMHPGMPQDGAEYYSRGHHPGMGGPHMGMGGPPMGAGCVGGMMDMPRGGPPHGRNTRIRNHPPRVPCKYYMTSQCRFGASCSFLHPGVNGPPLK